MGVEGTPKSTPKPPLGMKQCIAAGPGEGKAGESGEGRSQEQWDPGSIRLLTLSLSFPSTEDIDKDLVI